MKRVLFALLLACASAAVAADATHQVRLLDGSVLRGRVLSLDADRVLLATAYQDSLAIPRAQVAAILLRPELAALAPPPAAEPAQPGKSARFTAEGTGKVELSIEGSPIRSSVRSRDKNERDHMVALGTLYLRVFLDDKLLLTRSDESVEKEFREDNWYYMRNTHKFGTVSFDAPAGVHKLHVVIGNRQDLLREGESQGRLVSAEIILEELTVNANETSRVVLKGRGSKFKYGQYELELLSSR